MLKQQKSYFQVSLPLNDDYFLFLFYFIFCLKQDKIKFLSCNFPKKYTFLLMFKRSHSQPFFFNAAPAPLKKGRLLPAQDPALQPCSLWHISPALRSSIIVNILSISFMYWLYLLVHYGDSEINR